MNVLLSKQEKARRAASKSAQQEAQSPVSDERVLEGEEPRPAEEPTTPEPAPLQRTSTSRRRQTRERSDRLDRMLQQEETLRQSTQSAQEAAQAIGGTFEQGRQGADGQVEGGFTPGDRETDQGAASPDATQEQSGDILSPELQEREEGIRSEARQDVRQIERELATVEKRMDSASASLIQATRKIFDGRIKELEESNERLFKTVETQGIRAGRSRFNPQSQSGILTDTERDNIARVSKLEGMMLSAVADAQQARADNDLKVFNEKFDRIEQVREQMQSEIKELYDTAVSIEEERRLEQKERRMQQKEEFDQMLEQSERAAPGVAEAIGKYKDAEKQLQFINQYAEKTGIDPDVLYGDVTEAMDEKQKRALDRANTRSQMATREKNARISAAREARLQEEANEFASDNEVSAVKKYLASQGATQEDIDQVMNDEPVFFHVLKKAEQEEEFGDF